MKANYPSEIQIPKPKPTEAAIAEWIEKSWKKIVKNAPPDIHIILLAHAGKEMSIKGNTCMHASHEMLSAALDLNASLAEGLQQQKCAGDPARN